MKTKKNGGQVPAAAHTAAAAKPNRALMLPRPNEDTLASATLSPEATNATTSTIRGSSPPAPRPSVKAKPGTKAKVQTPEPTPRAEAKLASTTVLRASPLADPFLSLLAAQLYDFEKVRIASGNRHRILTTSEPDEDGVVRGLGRYPKAALLAPGIKGTMDGLASIEDEVEKMLKRQLREHPLHPWVARTIGVGEKLAARLLGAIGDPYWNDLHGRPRLVSELWAYCGLHGPKGRKRRGEKANWNQDAKVRVFLIAESCLKQTGEPDKNGKPRPRSPFRDVYDAARTRYKEKTHGDLCVRCGPSGKPALPGSPWSDGHKHMGAMRITMKEILRTLWLEAKAIHEAAANRGTEDQQGAAAASVLH